MTTNPLHNKLSCNQNQWHSKCGIFELHYITLTEEEEEEEEEGDIYL